MANLQDMVDDLSKKDTIAFDLETIGLDPQHERANIICFSLCGEAGKPYVVLWDHPENRLHKESIKEALDYLFDQDKVWVAHNGKFDCEWLGHFGFTVPNHSHDTIVMAHLLDENAPKNVESVAARYLGTPSWKYLMDPHFAAISRAIKKGQSIPYPPLDDLVKYAGLDTDIELQLYRTLWRRLDKSLRRIHNFLLDVSWVLESVEQYGVYMDPEALERKQEEYELRKEQAIQKISEATGLPPERCNPNSPPQMVNLLFDVLGLNVVETTTTGNASTNNHTLKMLRKDAPDVIGPILDYRKAAKFSGSYLRPWRTLLTKESRLRSSFNITGTVTGRLSCTNLTPWGGRGHGMSLHQVPRDGDIRSVVSAPPGRVLIVADYSQIELRVVAALANEPRMSQAYRDGEDLHTLTAATVLGKDLKDVTKEERTNAKPVNFGYVYGMGAKNFVKYAFDEYGVEFSLEESEDLRREYFRLYRGLRPWHRKVENYVRRYGQVISPLGRIRRLPDIYSSKKGLQFEAVRQAINSPVQATASDFTLMAMVLIHDAIQSSPKMQSVVRILGQVHDSILLECDERIAGFVAPTLKKIMEIHTPREIHKQFGYKFPLPLAADVEIVREWGGKSLSVLAPIAI